MKHYALIGEYLGHSMSVPIHEAIFRRLGIDADYRLVELPRDGFVEGARRLMDEVDGFNITIPYKQDIIPLLSGLDDAARAIGAVNTVSLDGPAVGYNTDVPGFAAMLRMHGIDPQGQPCYVLGTGGASKAVVAALHRMGAQRVTLVSRSPRGEGVIDYDRLAEEFSGVLVNTTPAGMLYQQDTCPIREDALPGILRRATGVADIIYNPPETVLTAAARRLGVPACTGMTMLIAQAVEAESIWQGYPMPDGLTETLDKELKLL